MAVQTQEEDNKVYIDLETMEETTSRNSARRKYLARQRQETEAIQAEQAKKNRKTFRRMIVLLGVFSALCGFYAIGRDTVDDDPFIGRDEPVVHMEEEGTALPEEMYIISDLDGNVITDPSREDAEYQSVYAWNDNAHDYVVSQHIIIGSTWQTFLDTYGSYTAESISFTGSTERKESTTLENISIEDFNKEYIENGRVDLRENIQIRFESIISKDGGAYLTYEGAGGYNNEDHYDNLQIGLQVPEEMHDADVSNLMVQTIYVDRYK